MTATQSPPSRSDAAVPGATASGVFPPDPVPTATAGIEATVQRGSARISIPRITFDAPPADRGCTGNSQARDLCPCCPRLGNAGAQIRPAAWRGKDGDYRCVNHPRIVQPAPAERKHLREVCGA